MNLTNQLLIATPEMQDERFKHAVILICEHNEHGALGINLNDPSTVNFSEVLSNLSIKESGDSLEQMVYEGGPVNTQCGFILHQSKSSFDSTIEVANELYLTTSKDILEAIANNKISVGWLLALGCATWDEGQLENEVANHDWLLMPATKELIFSHDADRWDMALAQMGIMAHQLSGDIGHA